MPLQDSSSKKAREANIATEIAAHPDKVKQDIAIGYAQQRRAKAKGYNAGGAADGDWAGLASDNAVEPGAQPTEELQAPDAPENAGLSGVSHLGSALSALGHGSKPSVQPPPTVSVKNVLGQQESDSGYSNGGEVQVGQPKLEQGQLGNEMRLPEMPITVEGDEHRFARLRSEDRPIERDEAGNALAAGLVGGAGAALRGGARALGSALGRQVVDPDKTAQVAIPPLRQLQAEAAKRLAARGAQKAGEAYVPPPPGYAMGGQVEAVHNHPSASLRWPLAHLTERGRRQASYNLGLHMKHHFDKGGMAGQELAAKNFPAPEEVSHHHPQHNPAVGETMLPTNYGAGRSLAEAGKSRAEPAAPAKSAQSTHEFPQAAQESAPIPAPKLSTEDQIEKERQEERQAALHPSVLDSIRRHVSNGLLAFGGKGIVDYGAQDAAAAKEANENAIQRLNVLHGNRKAAFEEAGQEAESPRSVAARAAAARILGVPASQFAGIPKADLDHMSSLALEVARTRGTQEEAAARLKLEEAWKATQASQGERRLGLEQQKINVGNRNAASQDELRTARMLAPVSKSLLQATAKQRDDMNQLQKVESNLDRMNKTGQASNVDVAAMATDLARLMGGGAASQGEIEAILPKSLHSRAAGLWQYVSGKSADTGLAGLTLQQYGELANSLKQALQHNYSRNVNTALAGHAQLEKAHPEAFQAWREQAAKGLPLSTYEEPEGGGEGTDDVDDDVMWFPNH